MNGPVHGVATKAASAPVQKAPLVPRRAASPPPPVIGGKLEQPGEVERDAR